MASSVAARTFQEALDEALNAMRTANPEHAVAMCDELLNASAYPDAVRALRLRGQALEALGDLMRAALDYERVLEICPTDTITALSYAKALSRLGRKEEAALIAHQLLDWMPNDADTQRIASEGVAVQAYDTPQNSGRLAAAQAQFAVGRSQLALNTVRKVVADALDRADARLMLATFLWRDGQRIQAAEHCQHLLDDEPDCLLAQALLVYIWNGTDALQQWHMRSVARLDPDHREVTQTLVPADEAALFEVVEVPAMPTVAGFAEEDIHDVSDGPDHDDFMDRLMASAGPINPQTQLAPTADSRPAPPRPSSPAVDELERDEDIVSYSRLDWEPEHDDDGTATRVDDVNEADTPPSWLTQVQASSRPTPEGTSMDDAAEDDALEKDSSEEMNSDDEDDDEDEAVDETTVDKAADVEAREADVVGTAHKAREWRGADNDTMPAAPVTPAAAETTPASLSTDPGEWLEAARAAINQRMTANSAEGQHKMIELAERMNAALADLQTLATTQPDPEWYTLLGKAYTIKGKVDAALAKSRQTPAE